MTKKSPTPQPYRVKKNKLEYKGQDKTILFKEVLSVYILTPTTKDLLPTKTKKKDNMATFLERGYFYFIILICSFTSYS